MDSCLSPAGQASQFRRHLALGAGFVLDRDIKPLGLQRDRQAEPDTHAVPLGRASLPQPRNAYRIADALPALDLRAPDRARHIVGPNNVGPETPQNGKERLLPGVSILAKSVPMDSLDTVEARQSLERGINHLPPSAARSCDRSIGTRGRPRRLVRNCPALYQARPSSQSSPAGRKRSGAPIR